MSIRPAASNDRTAVLRLVPWLAEQGTPPGRNQQQVAAADLKSVAETLDDRSPRAEILIAEAENEGIGFVHVKTVVDYYLQMPIGHISDLVVADTPKDKVSGARYWRRRTRARGH